MPCARAQTPCRQRGRCDPRRRGRRAHWSCGRCSKASQRQPLQRRWDRQSSQGRLATLLPPWRPGRTFPAPNISAGTASNAYVHWTAAHVRGIARDQEGCVRPPVCTMLPGRRGGIAPTLSIDGLVNPPLVCRWPLNVPPLKGQAIRCCAAGCASPMAALAPCVERFVLDHAALERLVIVGIAPGVAAGRRPQVATPSRGHGIAVEMQALTPPSPHPCNGRPHCSACAATGAESLNAAAAPCRRARPCDVRRAARRSRRRG
jgi:hypothetical protein